MIWDSHREEKERRRFVEQGLSKRSPALAVSGFFLAMWLSGWACSAALLALGMHSIAARYALSTLVSYAVFICLVGMWCRQVVRPEKADSNSDSVLDGLDVPTGGDWDGCLIVLAVLGIGLLLSGLFWFVGGYALLFEVAFEVAFAGTMVFRMNKNDTLGNWAAILIRRTWLPALIMSGLLVGVGAKLQHDHPTARTLSQAIKAERAAEK